MPNINGEIEKLEINERIGFTGPMMTGQLMQIKAKINEIIDVINLMNEEPYTGDLDAEDADDKVLLDEADFEIENNPLLKKRMKNSQ